MGKKVERDMKARVKERSREGKTVAEISLEFRLGKSTIWKILRKKGVEKEAFGRPRKLSKRDLQRIVAYFRSKPLNSCREAISDLNLSVSERTLQRTLKEKDFLQKRVKKVQQISPRNCDKRLLFTRSHVVWPQSQWDLVVFTDEKKFNLFGNDAGTSAWLEKGSTVTLRGEFPNRTGLMVWGAISSKGTLELICVDEKINADIYIEMLEKDFFSKWEKDLPEGFIFQQDNAPAHSAVKTKEYLLKKKVNTMNWPPQSPDLNPIENVWAMMTCSMYEKGKFYHNTDELWEAIISAWRKIGPQIISNLYNSMGKRCTEVLERQGKRASY